MLQETLTTCVRGIVRIYAWLMYDLDVVWHEEPPEGAKIIAPNHPTTGDPFLVASLFSGEPRVLIEEMLFKVPVGGTLLRLLEQVPVVPGHGRIAYETAKWLLAEGHTVIIFPEGEISPADGGLCTPHTGVARLALETGAPVIPLGIHLDRSRICEVETTIEGKPEIGTWYARGPYTMSVGETLYLEGEVEDRARVRESTGQIMQRIAWLVEESARRMQPAVGTVGRVRLPNLDVM